IAAAVERVGVREGDGIEAVEFASPGQGDTGSADLDVGGRGPCGAQAAGQVAISVLVTLALEAVDSGRTLPAQGPGETSLVRSCCSRTAGAEETERSALGSGAITGCLGKTVDRDNAADRLRTPQGRLRPSNDLDPGGEVRVEDFEPWCVTGGGIVDLDPVHEDDAVVRLGTADADLG